MRRPFLGRREVRSGAPPGRHRQSLTVYRFGQLLLHGQSEASELLGTAPSLPANDLRPDVVIEDAAKIGLVERRERRRVLAVTCQVYRAPKTAGAGHLIPAERDDSAFSDLCFAANGILLEEATFRNGRLVHRRIAVAVDTTTALADTLFATSGTPLALAKGGGSVRRVDPSSRPASGPFYELDAPPDGFTLAERDATVPPQPENFTDPGRRDFRVAGVVDTYVRGADAIFIDQGGTLGGQPPFAPAPEAGAVDLGSLGTGEAFPGLDGNEVRVNLGAGRYVRVAGTIGIERLAALARHLTPQVGSGLVYLNG